MGFLSQIGDLLKHYSSGGNPLGVEQRFEQVAQTVLPSNRRRIGRGVSLRTNRIHPQTAAKLFANGNSQQQAGVLNGLMATLRPAVIAKFAGSAPNPLAAILLSGSVNSQAASGSPAEVDAPASHAQNQDPSIIDRISATYAEPPVLIKSLGAAALTIAMKKIADQHAA